MTTMQILCLMLHNLPVTLRPVSSHEDLHTRTYRCCIVTIITIITRTKDRIRT